VDPNEGDVRDAVLVRCDHITKSTCVKPQPDHIGPIDFENRNPQPEIWLSEFGYTGQVVNNSENKNIKPIQIEFLILDIIQS